MAEGMTLSPFWNFLVCASVDILAELGDQLRGLLVFVVQCMYSVGAGVLTYFGWVLCG